MTRDLDSRVRNALIDAAAHTSTSEGALAAIHRRAMVHEHPSPRRGNRLPMVGAAIAVALVGVAGLVVVTRGGDELTPGAVPAAESPSVPEAPPAGPVWEYPQSQHPVGREWRELVDVSDFRAIGDRMLAEYERRVQACMSSRGFDYVPLVYADSDPWFGRALNPLNEAAASEYGYHLPPMPQNVDRNVATPEFATALGGTDEDQTLGCADPASRAVFGPLSPALDAQQALMIEVDTAIAGFDGSEEGTAANEQWVACMQQRGYEYVSQLAARESFINAPEVSPDEIEVRSADLECDQATDLTVTRSDWERVRFDDWMDSSAPQMSELRQLFNEASTTLTRLESEGLTGE